jgi:hypothetical protein
MRLVMQSLLAERFKLAVHLETQVVGRVFHALSLVTVLRERQQRRCEASGEPFQELPAFPPGPKLRSIAEILRNGRLRPYERNLALRDGAGAAEIATDNRNISCTTFRWRFGLSAASVDRSGPVSPG